jgi:prepilin-type N-terminal cleavage/methylation domain-containing protein
MRHAFTLIELLVVISIIAILAGMLMPAIGLVQEMARRGKCGSNQRQIVMAMMVYAQENDQRLPARPSLASGAAVPSGGTPDPGATARASLELLVVDQGGELAERLFACPSLPQVSPPPVSGSLTCGTGTSTWAAANLATSDAIPAYAYDWTAPVNSRAVRVLVADRCKDPTASPHGRVVVAAFADGHTDQLRRAGLTGAAGTASTDIDGNSVTAVYRNADARDNASGAEDNIFDGADDGVANYDLPGRGSATRAWVR